MSPLVAKALTVARSRLRRIISRPPVITVLQGKVADPTKFELPACPPQLRDASRSELVEWYWRLHPRFNFFKGVVPGARVLDIGVGTGGLPFWREFLVPVRSDVRVFGFDLAKPLAAAVYEQFFVGDLDDGLPFGDCVFDAVVASHVLEHVAKIAPAVAHIGRCLRIGGIAYVEMPSPHTKAASFRRGLSRGRLADDHLQLSRRCDAS